MNLRQTQIEGSRISTMTTSNARSSQELEEISIVSANATPSQVTYGTGPHTANGPRVVPGMRTLGRGGFTGRGLRYSPNKKCAKLRLFKEIKVSPSQNLLLDPSLL